MFIEELFSNTRGSKQPMIYEYSYALDSLKCTEKIVFDWLAEDKGENRTHGYLISFFNFKTLKRELVVLFGEGNELFLDYGFGPKKLGRDFSLGLTKCFNIIRIEFLGKETKKILVWDSLIRKLLSDGQDEISSFEPIHFILTRISDASVRRRYAQLLTRGMTFPV